MKPSRAAFAPTELDIEAFIKQSAHLEGQWPLTTLPRLLSSVQADSAASGRSVNWHIDGEVRTPAGSDPQLWLHVAAEVQVWMECQRCLNPVEQPLSVQRSFLFVRGEEAAAQLDADFDDDVMALTRSLDVQALIEDELLLGLPLVPRHPVCPEPLALAPQAFPEDDEPPHPFAALAALKRGGGLPN